MTFELYLRYVQQRTSPEETRVVQAWLANPANSFQLQAWMSRYAQLVEEEGGVAEMRGYDRLEAHLLTQLGLVPAAAPAPRRWWPPLAAAAAFVGLVVSGAWLWQATPAATKLTRTKAAKSTQLTTGYGQTRRVQLPDGSLVTLQANSTLRFAPAWNSGAPREVWLDGEAFFSVKHLPTHQRFRVHTSGNFNVEVLGTQFTVYRRHAQQRVVLLSGKVRVDFQDQHRADVILNPGELLQTTDSQPRQVVHKTVRTAPYAAVATDKLVFDDTPLAELATQLHDRYGVEVVVLDPALNEQPITGTVATGDLDLLCQAIQACCSIRAERHGQRILLSRL